MEQSEQLPEDLTEEEIEDFLKEHSYTVLPGVDHEGRPHALLSPSSADRWGKCIASLQYTDDATNEAAEEGTRAHEFLEQMLMGQDVTVPDKEMLGYLEETLEYIREVEQDIKNAMSFTEQRFTFNEVFFGTADRTTIGQDERDRNIIHVFDFKYGIRNFVDIGETPQIPIYASLAIHELLQKNGFLPDDKLKTAVTVHVMQPRMNNFASRSMSLAQLRDEVAPYVKVADEIINNDKLAHIGESDIVPGTHCRWCPGKTQCEKHLDYESEMLLPFVPDLPLDKDVSRNREVKEQIKSIVSRTPKEKLYNLFRHRFLINELQKAAAKELYNEALHGTDLPIKLVKGKVNRAWIDDEETTAKNIKKLGIKDPYKKSLKGIGDLESELGKRKGELNTLLYKPEAPLVLVDESDPREKVESDKELIESVPAIKGE